MYVIAKMLYIAGKLQERFCQKKIVSKVYDKSIARWHMKFGGQIKENDASEVEKTLFERK